MAHPVGAEHRRADVSRPPGGVDRADQPVQLIRELVARLDDRADDALRLQLAHRRGRLAHRRARLRQIGGGSGEAGQIDGAVRTAQLLRVDVLRGVDERREGVVGELIDGRGEVVAGRERPAEQRELRQPGPDEIAGQVARCPRLGADLREPLRECGDVTVGYRRAQPGHLVAGIHQMLAGQQCPNADPGDQGQQDHQEPEARPEAAPPGKQSSQPPCLRCCSAMSAVRPRECQRQSGSWARSGFGQPMWSFSRSSLITRSRLGPWRPGVCRGRSLSSRACNSRRTGSHRRTSRRTCARAPG